MENLAATPNHFECIWSWGDLDMLPVRECKAMTARDYVKLNPR